MRNLIDERPSTDLHGVALQAGQLLSADDCRDRDVLDIGCGFGGFCLLALDRGARSVMGIEPTEDDIATARRHLDDSRLRLEVGSALAIPAPDGSFDTVGCWEVLEHLPVGTEEQAFAEIARVLRPGGLFCMSTPYASAAGRITDPAWWLIGHRHYRRDRLRELAASAGLEVEAVYVRGGWWQVLMMNNMYVAKWIFRRRPFFGDAMLRRVDREMLGSRGFTNAFMRCRKAS